MNASACDTAMRVSFASISQDEAKECIRKWHYAGHLGRGQQFYGALLGTQLIACTVFDDTNCSIRTTEFMACGRDNLIHSRIFQMSQLLAWCCKQLKQDYDLILTYCELHRSGSIFNGASWNYSGTTSLYHAYWKALSPSGVNLACQQGLKSLKYPACK